MVFPSLPLYLDPPNWQQPPIQQQGEEGGGGVRGENNNHHLPLPLPPLPSGGSGCGTGSIRPGSMTDKARLAKVPHPEAALKCPRCDSTNTKFCYFNNYSLTQPRHFCKTCRRYWTRGGALRNVPVGGGCRRNKRSSSSKGSRSKSPAPGGQGCGGGSNSSSTSSVLPSSSSDMISHFPNFLTHLNHQQLSDYGSAGEIGLSFGGIQPPIGPPTGSGGGRGNNNNEMEFNSGFAEQWRLQQGHQFHFLNNLEPQTAGNMYPFETEGVVGVEPPQSYSSQIRAKALNTAMAAVKVEDINNQQNLSRNFLGISGGHDDHNQYWINGGGGGSGGGGGGNVNAWSDLAGFNINSSLSTRHLL